MTKEECDDVRKQHNGLLPYIKGSVIYVEGKQLKWNKKIQSY